MVRTFDIDLANYKSLAEWVPQVGDFIIHHGWIFNKWFGIVKGIDAKGTLSITKSGLPTLLLTMSPDEIENNTVQISYHKIKSAPTGKYAICRQGVDGMWFI